MQKKAVVNAIAATVQKRVGFYFLRVALTAAQYCLEGMGGKACRGGQSSQLILSPTVA